MDTRSIAVVGATGDLGHRIVHALARRGAFVRVLVRKGADPAKVEALKRDGVTIIEADFQTVDSMAPHFEGVACVVSALSGLRDVIVTAQTLVLDAAIKAGVHRFIPSDYAMDFMKLPPGTNRNFDLRREFHEVLEGRLARSEMKATSILNGAFTELLTGEAPLIVFPLRRVVYWEDSEQILDFTTKDDIADFTAAAALDSTTPRTLRISGDRQTAKTLAEVASDVTGKKFSLFRAGGLDRLERLIYLTRAITPSPGVVFPPWQGMQYMRDMFDGAGVLQPLDNDRYSDIHFITAKDVIRAKARR